MKKEGDSRKYYEAYDERYKVAHAQGLHWFSDNASPIVTQTVKKHHISSQMRVLELGCGEGRDAHHLLKNGFTHLLATDISPEAIRYCKQKWPEFESSFQVLDCINDTIEQAFDFIYAVAVVHMFLLDEDRNAFYRFIHEHLAEDGIALICTMGDGNTERQSDIKTAFELQERECDGKTVRVAGTSCRMVTSQAFARELTRNHLAVIEQGQTSIPNEFTDMMYAVVKRA